MQNIRSNLTRLKKSTQEILPDAQDVYGYPGISKDMVIELIDNSYNFSYELSKMEPNYEITILKRKIGKSIESCKGLLKSGFDGYLKDKYFDEFLDHITNIRDQIRVTYLVVIDKALRKEAEISCILNSYEELKETYEKYEDKFHDIEYSLISVTVFWSSKTGHVSLKYRSLKD